MLKHLQSIYAKTRWPFFRIQNIINAGFTREEANKLRIEGKIRKRKGINGDIIELIIE